MQDAAACSRKVQFEVFQELCAILAPETSAARPICRHAVAGLLRTLASSAVFSEANDGRCVGRTRNPCFAVLRDGLTVQGGLSAAHVAARSLRHLGHNCRI